jgi:hypothetical protein
MQFYVPSPRFVSSVLSRFPAASSYSRQPRGGEILGTRVHTEITEGDEGTEKLVFSFSWSMLSSVPSPRSVSSVLSRFPPAPIHA